MRSPSLRVLTTAVATSAVVAGVAALPVSARAQATVSGTVFDSISRVMLAGAIVQVVRADDPYRFSVAFPE